MDNLLIVKKENLNKDFANIDFLAKYMRNRVLKSNRNFLCCVIGATGTGKSYTSLKLGTMTDPDFKMDNVVFSQKEFIDLLNSGKLKRGSAIIYDEIGVSQNARNWYSQTNKLLNGILQTFRHLNLIVFFTVPAMCFVDKQARLLFHGIIECKSVDFHDKIGFAKPYFLQYNQQQDKVYQKFLQVNLDGVHYKINHIKVPSVDKKLSNEYEIKRFQYTSKLYAQVEKEAIKEEENPKLHKATKKQQIIELVLQGFRNVDIVKKLRVDSTYICQVKQYMKSQGLIK